MKAIFVAQICGTIGVPQAVVRSAAHARRARVFIAGKDTHTRRPNFVRRVWYGDTRAAAAGVSVKTALKILALAAGDSAILAFGPSLGCDAVAAEAVFFFFFFWPLPHRVPTATRSPPTAAPVERTHHAAPGSCSEARVRVMVSKRSESIKITSSIRCAGGHTLPGQQNMSAQTGSARSAIAAQAITVP